MFYPILLLAMAPVYANVIFLPHGQIYASYNHWNLHFPIETRTSWTYVEKIVHRIEVFKSKFSTRFTEHRQQMRSDLAERLWRKFMTDSDLLDREINLTISALKHLKTPDPIRAKRSLLPIVGDALSSLFGTATTTEIQDILSRVNDLSDSQTDVLNVIDNTVTMVNETIVDVSMNRQTIIRLTNVTDYLTERLDLLKNLELDDYFASDLESNMETVFVDLITTVQEFRKSVMELETIFSLAENNILPRSLLPPSRFARILDDIQKVLPRDLVLPFPPSAVDKYFTISPTQTIRTAEGISVLVTIPLLSIRDHFSVFQIFNIPVPKTANNQNFVANYEIEKAKFVAISEDSLKFVFIDDDDVQTYLRRRLPFCPLRRPIMNVMTSTMCIPALLTNQTDKIMRLCENVIQVNQSVDPTAEYLGNGHWIVISNDPIELEVRCKNGTIVNSTTTVKTVSPLSLVKLDFGCAAFNTHFQLPTYYRTDSYLEPYQIQQFNLTLTLNDVWEHITSSFPEGFNHVVDTLPPIQMKSVRLSALKSHLRLMKDLNRHHYRTVIVPAVSVTTVAVLVALVLFILKCTRCPMVYLCPNRTMSCKSHPSDGSTGRDVTLQDEPTDLTDKTKMTPGTSPSWLTK